MTERLMERSMFPGRRIIDGLSRLVWRARSRRESVDQDQFNSSVITDRPEHLDMFPDRGGVHVPNVPRYKSGFRNWYAEKANQ